MDPMPTVRVTDLPDEAVLVDVREPEEWAAGHAPKAVHIPLGEIPGRLGDLPENDDPLPVVCRSGGRSQRAVQWLVQQGFDVVNVDGGMRAWRAAGKPLTAEHTDDPHVL